jgi:membrane-bound inhibitor of C-type lysozyme
MIKRVCGFLAVLGFLAAAPAASLAQMSAQARPLPAKVTTFYMCNGLHFKAVYDNRRDRVSFVWGAKDYHLPRVRSADGARYANNQLEWWSKGPNAALYTLPEHTRLTSCTPGRRF